MKPTSIIAIILIFGFCLFGVSKSNAQQKQIDSLENQLHLFEIRKKESGAKATQLGDTVKVHILTELFKTHYANNNLDIALKYANEELALSKKINYKWGIGTSYNFIGVIYERKSDYATAIEFYKRSLLVKEGTNNKIGQVDSYQNIGIAHAKLARFPEALRYILKAIHISKSINDDYGIMGGYNNLGLIYNSQQKYPQALKSYFICLEVAKKLKDDFTSSVIYLNIGEIYILQKDNKKASEYLKKGLQLANVSGNKESEANAYSAIGKLLQHEKKYAESLQYLNQALKIRQDIEFSYGISSSYISVGNNYFMLGNNKKAKEFIAIGLASAKESGELELMNEAYDYLSKIYVAEGNYKMAYHNYVDFATLKDSIFNLDKDKKITQIQMEYDFKIVQDSIKDAQYKKDLFAREKSQQDIRTRNSIFIILGIIVVFLIILIIQRNKISEIKREKALAQERNRISRDLHDNLGAQLSTARMFISNLKKNNETVAETVDSTILMLDDSIDELRKIMNDTNHSILSDKGYIVATEELINKINQLHVIEFSLSHHNMEKRPNTKIEQEMFRITQELVNNTLKYADARYVSIDVLQRDGKFILMYEDDGKGFDVNLIVKGNGLNNITTRANNVNGTVEFDSSPDNGSRTIVEIPLNS